MGLPIVATAAAGFGVLKRNPGAAVVWGVYLLLLYAIFGGIIFAIAGTAIMDSVRSATPGDPTVGLRMVSTILPAELVGVPLLLIGYSVLFGAIFRSVLFPAEKGFAYLRLGSRELKLAVSIILMTLLTWIVLAVIAVGFGALTGGFAMTNVHGPMGMLSVLRLATPVVYVISFLVYIGFALSYPAAFAENGIRVFAGWKLALRDYLRLAAAFILLFAMMIVALIAIVIVLAVVLAVTGGAAALNGSGAGALGVIGVIGLVVAGLVYLAILVGFVVCMAATQAEAYRRLSAA